VLIVSDAATLIFSDAQQLLPCAVVRKSGAG